MHAGTVAKCVSYHVSVAASITGHRGYATPSTAAELRAGCRTREPASLETRGYRPARALEIAWQAKALEYSYRSAAMAALVVASAASSVSSLPSAMVTGSPSQYNVHRGWQSVLGFLELKLL